MPATTASRAVLELNGLVLFKYNSIYGYAYEVLTQNGRERVAHGNNEETVLKESIRYLEARAVLSGVPMRVPGGNYTSGAANTNHALDAERYNALLRAELEKIKLKCFEKERKQHVLGLGKLASYRSDISGGSRLLEYGEDPGRAVSGAQSEKKV